MKAKNKGWDIKKRWWYLTAFIDRSMASLSNTEIVIWLMLWRDTKKNGLARTAVSYLAKRAGMSERMIQIGIRSLIKKGMLKRIKRGGNSHGKKWVSLWKVWPFKDEHETGFVIPSKGTWNDGLDESGFRLRTSPEQEAAMVKAWRNALSRKNGQQAATSTLVG